MSKKQPRTPIEKAKRMVRRKTRHGVSRHEAKSKVINVITSISTEQKYFSCTKLFYEWLREKGYSISRINAANIEEFLIAKAEVCVQKTLDGYRQALQLVHNVDVSYVVSKRPTILVPRAYRGEQICFLAGLADPDLGFSIRLAAEAGLRAIELDTISRLSELSEDSRPWLLERFLGLDDHVRFVVVGKGGLKRKVSISKSLADELETYRLNQMTIKKQRGINYRKFYSITGGHSFSQKFSRLSIQRLGWSTGAHGLRHRFAQNRIHALQMMGFTYAYALKIVAQELGHFGITNTLTYMR